MLPLVQKRYFCSQNNLVNGARASSFVLMHDDDIGIGIPCVDVTSRRLSENPRRHLKWTCLTNGCMLFTTTQCLPALRVTPRCSHLEFLLLVLVMSLLRTIVKWYLHFI